MKKANDYINLLPPETKAPRFVAGKPALIAGVFVLVWFAVFGWQAKQFLELRAALELRTMKKEALRLQLATFYKDLGISLPQGMSPEKAWLIQNLLRERVLWSEVFKQFSLIVPRGLWFDSLEGSTVTKAEIKIRGGAVAYATVSAFLLAMEQSPYFEKPQLLSAQKVVVQGRETIGFEIVSGVKRVQGAR